jgi:hypothetical protein
VIEEFRGSTFDGWFVTGEALLGGPVRAGEIVIGESRQRPIARFTSGGADSGVLSNRLQGELRSRTFTINKPFVHLRIAGKGTRVNLVIDGYTLIMNPIYGKLTAAPASDSLTWRTMPVDRWIGHPAYVEISDSRIPMHGLNPPPSSARVPDKLGDGYIAVEQVLLSDDPEPPAGQSEVSAAALERVGSGKLDELAAAYQELMVQAVQHWRTGKLESADNGDDFVALLNWQLENGLLDGDPPAADQFAAKDSLAGLVAQYHTLESSLPQPQRAPALADGTGEDEFVFLRGSYRTLGERAPRGPPEALGVGGGPPAGPGSGRLDLARDLVDRANPLLARVLANRLWQHHFGEGIVRTPDDFGRMGQPPTHPELLDHLAAELARGDWSIKRMHRAVLHSSTYRQSSAGRGAGKVEPQHSTSVVLSSELGDPSLVDPENRLLSRMKIRRLEAEAIRDSMLAVSGRLSPAIGGPSVLPYLTPYMEGRGRPNSGPLDGDGRRSIYINARRNFLTPLLLAFDYPVTFTPIGRRGAASVPAQALTLMNDPFVVQQAGQWAEDVGRDHDRSREQQIHWLYVTAFARPPSPNELREALAFVERQAKQHGGADDDQRAWADLCHVLFNVKEFIFID